MPYTQAEIDAAALDLSNNPKLRAKLDAYTKQVQDSAKPPQDVLPPKSDHDIRVNPTSSSTLATPDQTPEPTPVEIALSLFMLIVAVISFVWVLRIIYGWATGALRGIKKGAVSCADSGSKNAGGLKAACFLAMRGRLVVRASTFLMALLQPDSTPERANALAASIDSYAAYQLRAAALFHLNEAYNGSRLAMISEARLRGFKG